MVVPFGALRGAARTQLFRQYAQARWSPAITANQIISETRAIGLSIRRTDALAIVREMSGRAISRSRIQFVPGGAVPGLDMYAKTELKLSKPFQTIFEVRGSNALTGEPLTRDVSFLSDELMSVNAMKAELLETIRLSEGPSGIVLPMTLKPIEGLARATPPFIAEG